MAINVHERPHTYESAYQYYVEIFTRDVSDPLFSQDQLNRKVIDNRYFYTQRPFIDSLQFHLGMCQDLLHPCCIQAILDFMCRYLDVQICEAATDLSRLTIEEFVGKVKAEME